MMGGETRLETSEKKMLGESLKEIEEQSSDPRT